MTIQTTTEQQGTKMHLQRPSNCNGLLVTTTMLNRHHQHKQTKIRKYTFGHCYYYYFVIIIIKDIYIAQNS